MKTTISRYYWSYQGGRAEIGASAEGLTHFHPASSILYHATWGDLHEEADTGSCGAAIMEADNWLSAAFAQLEEYLAGDRYHFIIPFDLQGTEFQMQVWQTMLRIPFGQTVTYQELATEIGKPSAVRAVANACGQNPLPIFIPCHRVVAKHGLGGYSDPEGIQVKKWLLQHERAHT